MTAGNLKGIAIGCFVVAALLAFFGWYEYNENAKKVAAMNAMMSGGPFGGNSPFGENPFGGMMPPMTGGLKLEPSTPKATVYCLILAGVSAVGGVVCLVMAGKQATA